MMSLLPLVEVEGNDEIDAEANAKA